ncbi:MAG: NUDIX domain-containing protein [Symploca sp. SIO2B6]|nr:NUDIX domain-containing protein [Symploca sp. SIO2B6]
MFINTATGVAAVIESEGDLLLVVRGRNPGKGLLDLPGGFVDYHETAEAALVRELKEELELDLSMELSWNSDNPDSASALPLNYHRPPLDTCYIGSYPNTYLYKNVTYEVTDLFYHIVLETKPVLEAHDDVAGFVWVPRHAIPIEKMAFSSGRNIMTQYQDTLSDG